MHRWGLVDAGSIAGGANGLLRRCQQWLSNPLISCHAQGHGRAARAKPELVLNNFDTRLGHRLGRMFASLFHQDPSFRSRQVATLHNQRDFIFFR